MRWSRPAAVLLLALAGAPIAAWGQAPAAVDTGGTILHSVEVVRHNVFDSTQTHAFYARLMNALHIITRDGVVRNEVLLKPGQPYNPRLAAETARNLRRLGIFEKVELDTIRTDSGVALRVTTQDAWSTKPAANFKSTGGQISWAVALLEDNLLGTNTHLFSKYAVDPDRTTLGFALVKQRLIARRLSLLLNYQDLSDGRIFLSQFGLPYLSLSARAQAMLTVQSGDVRILEYQNGNTAAAADSVGRRYQIIRGDFGWAPRADPAGYVRLGLTAVARRDDFRPYASGTPFGESWFGALTGTAEWRRARYTILRGFSSMSRDEDVDLSTTVSGGLAVAPSAWGYAANGAGPVLAFH
ncbi:MAG: POTRA domain-containing protein, partial [Gemmatimonadales bacterium]